uniref:Poly [ADP-ribose] polymerase n=1 Tax=Parastrongyloides trichosuri TaxID=131310 RepID=A0A0N4ZDI6_PARTI
MSLNKPKQKIIDKHPMDDFYDKMKCKLIHLDEENKMRKTIGDVLRDTKCPTHTWYKYEVKKVFEIERLTKQDKFFEKIPNKKLLWHGSRVTNWYGILSQGLRMAPKGAPFNGYMFDKGIYMADLSSKSIPFGCGAPGQKG